MNDSDLKTQPTHLQRLGRFFIASGLIALIWTLVLPQVARIAPIERHIRTMQERDINVGAMFYSELNWQAPPGFVFGSRSTAPTDLTETPPENR
jgi:hypothetical protein